MNELQNMSVSNNSGGGGSLTSFGGLASGCVQFYPYTQPCNGYPSYQYIYVTQTAPTECSGDVHVFPCAKCGDCKCGKAKLAKGQGK